MVVTNSSTKSISLSRPGVPKVLILLTDGSQTQDKDAVDPSLIAKTLRDAGITIYVIGIGTQVNKDELMRIAGGSQYTHTTTSFDNLVKPKFVQKISNDSCRTGE